MQIIEADSEQAVVDVLREGQPLEIIGCGSKLGLGRPVQVDRRLSLANWRGVTLYEPEELILSVKAGTLLSEIEPLLAGQGQTLAFEPPDLSGLLASPSAEQTIGGIVASALAGPRLARRQWPRRIVPRRRAGGEECHRL
jgi:glycolate oxidase FAD binding subunit